MRTYSLLFFILINYSSFSQANFPELSPKGIVVQKIGLTTISIAYERPASRGRQIFGGLVAYDKLWRTGAGNCTKISFSNPVFINDKKIDRGTYSLFTIPSRKNWTIILNSDTTLYGTSNYNEQKNVVVFQTNSQRSSRFYESLNIDIDVVPNNANIYISWGNTEISFKVDTEIDKFSNEFIEQNLLTDKSKDSDEYARAAEYYYYLNKKLDKALLLIDKALAKKGEAWYYRQKIDILEKQKKYKEAIACSNLAIEVNQKRTEWDEQTKFQNNEELKKRIETFKKNLLK